MAPVLVEDILSKILCVCDIATVLTVSLASRTLHALSMSKHVWLAQLLDLQHRGFVDLLAGQRLDELSTAELVDLAKRAVLGPETWSTSNPSPPVIARQIFVKPNIRHGPGILEWENRPQLLPGGRFVLFLQSGDIECRSTFEDKLIWAYRPRSLSDYVLDYAADVVNGGQTVMILLGIRTYERHKNSTNYLEVVHLNLNTGLSTSRVVTAAPDSSHDRPFGRLCIQGDFAAASLIRDRVVVLQISTASSTTFSLPSQFVDLALVPQHLILLKADKLSYLKVWRMRDLLERGSECAPIDSVEPIVTTALPDHGDPHASAHLASNLSPLREDTSTIWAFISTAAPVDGVTVHKYRVSHPHSKPLSITPMSSPVRRGQPQISHEVHDVSFPGFMNVRTHVMSPELGFKPVELPDSGDHVHMSAYSGALTYATWQKVVINYYK
ncbi:hypothetical protein LshimejAT787_1402210 [Lyophyllum shimeji]|uniref:F-box domain-containing protein n=1 Tax=Lyophyllum shimeji TaxID=47721 RepID=A0A9P3PYC2_LYOSH|nr:hypothetical protein LshimejAT787_1402210 [Lyophyllum shimeji]